MHVNINEDGPVKAMELTAGNVHDSQVFTELLSIDEEKLFADSTYASEKTNIWWAERDIENGVLAREPTAIKKLTDEQKKANKPYHALATLLIVFWVAKLHYGMTKTRYLGLNRNKIRVTMICMAHNTEREVSLQREIDETWESYNC